MRLLRNPEFRRPFWIAVAEAAISLIVAFVLLACGAERSLLFWVMVPALLLCIAVFTVGAWSFFKKIRAFTLKADESLHDRRVLQFDDFEEGDLSVMKNVFQSMARSHALKAEQLEQEKGLLQQFLAYMTHQLKTPLHKMMQTGEALMEADVSEDERKRAARKIIDTTNHINILVETLLKLSRLDADAVIFRSEPIPAGELIDSVCEPLEMTMELRDITLVKNVPAGIVLHSDPLWLKEALMNIVKNCMEHTPAGGTVTVTVTDSPVSTKIVIRDTGPGIAEEDLPHVFERFYRGKDAGPNSVGIGLAFTKQVIGALGGKVDDPPKNAPDGGAVFTVTMGSKMNI